MRFPTLPEVFLASNGEEVSSLILRKEEKRVFLIPRYTAQGSRANGPTERRKGRGLRSVRVEKGSRHAHLF